MRVEIGPYINNPKSKKKRKIKVTIHSYDMWSLDHTLALIILPALKKFKKYADKRWDKDDMDKMIWSFDQIANEKEYDDPLYKKDYKAYLKKLQEGIDLFAKRFQGLWT